MCLLVAAQSIFRDDDGTSLLQHQYTTLQCYPKGNSSPGESVPVNDVLSERREGNFNHLSGEKSSSTVLSHEHRGVLCRMGKDGH